MRRAHGEEGLFFGLGDPSAPPVVFELHPDQHFGPASEGRAIEIFTADRPVEHVAQ
jgi:hypothetical protein